MQDARIYLGGKTNGIIRNSNKRVQRTRHKVSGPLTRDVRQRRKNNMKRNIYWLIATVLSLTWADAVRAESNTTADAIKSAVERTLRAYREEDMAAMLSTVHSQAPSYMSIKKDSPTVFENYDINAELISFTFIGQDEDYAVARTKIRYTKISGPAFQNTEFDTFSVYRKENDEWKTWDGCIVDRKYLNE